MKNFKQFIIFRDYIVRFFDAIMSISFFNINLCSVHFSFDISYSIVDSFLSTYLYYNMTGF